MARKRVLISDIDGVVVDSSTRFNHYTDWAAKARGDIKALRASYERASATLEGDVPINSGILVVKGLYESFQVDAMAWITARNESGRNLTEQQLVDYTDLPVDHLFMRPQLPDDHPHVAPEDMKEDYLNHLQTEWDYEVVAAVEDHPDIAAMYRRRGIVCVLLTIPHVDCLTPQGYDLAAQKVEKL